MLASPAGTHFRAPQGGRELAGQHRQRVDSGGTRRPTGADGGRPAGATGLRALLAGNRPYLVAVLGVLTLASLMISGPLHHYLDGRERLELLNRKRAALTAEIERLERRVSDLEDPAQLERLAREQLGLIRPDEIPYVVVTPEPQRSQPAPAQPNTYDAPWYWRVWEALVGLVH